MGGGLAHRRTVGRNARGGSKTTVVPPYRLTAFALLTVLACAGPRQDVDPAPVEADGFSLVLNNRHLLDVNVFVQHDGQSDRVATVVASTSRTMVLPTWMLGQSKAIRLIAEPIGEETRYVTDILVVQPGQMVELNVEGSLARSNYSIQ
ncbi:MAG TPA: hypothetical protein VF252_01030 [Gemmatimonadales bacterium]